jgi:hypothetical protein
LIFCTFIEHIIIYIWDLLFEFFWNLKMWFWLLKKKSYVWLGLK